MKSFFLFNKHFSIIEILSIILIGTVILIPMPMSNISIALSEIVALAIFTYIFIYEGLYKHKYFNSVFSKRMFWLLFSFGLYFIILSAARLMLHMSFADSVWGVRALILGSSVFFLMNEYKPKVDETLKGIIFIYTILNIREIADCFKFSDIRKLSFLDNINIYIYITIMLIPFAVFAIRESNKKRLPSWISRLSYINMGISMVITLVSGGRLGWLVMIFVLFISMFLIFGFRWYAWKRTLSLLLCCIIITAVSASFNFMQSRTNIYRSTSYFLYKIPGFQESRLDIFDNISEEEDDLGDSIETTQESDRIRTTFWKNAWTSIKKNPILGAGTFAVAYKIDGEEQIPRPAHNFILEAWMGWGAIGLILYIVTWLYAAFYILTNMRKMSVFMRLYCVLPLSAAFLVSLLQSFAVLSFSAVYLMWFSVGFASVVENAEQY